MRPSFLLSLGAVLVAASSASALGFGPTGPKAVAYTPENTAETRTHLGASAATSLQGVRRIAIPQFQVEYVTKSEGLSRKERNQVTVVYAFAEPSAAALQAETDKLYARLVARLEAQGFEVVPREALEATAGWKKLAGIGKPSGSEFKSESGSGRLFVAGGAPYYFYPGDTHLGTGAISWGFAQAQMAEQQAAGELDASLLTVRLVIGIRETDKHSQAFALVRTASSFEGEPWLTLEAPASGAFIVTPGRTGGMTNPTGRAALTLKDSLLFPQDVLNPTLKNATSGAGAAGNAASSALFAGMVLANMAGAGVGGKLYKSYRFEASPSEAEYLDAVDRNAGGVTDALVEQLKAATN